MANDSIFQVLAAAAQKSEPVALGIICSVKGSSPQKIGAKAVFFADGRIKGTMGGGCLEAEIQHRAIQSLRTGKPETFDLLLDHDFGWDDGLICGGKVSGVILPNAQAAGAEFWLPLAERKTARTWGVRGNLALSAAVPKDLTSAEERDWLYRETVEPPCALWVAGAGHIAQAVAPLALRLDFAVTVLDDRPALASHTWFPEGVSLKADLWENLFALPGPEGPAFALIVTRGHRHDALVLQNWLTRPFLFIGMIGSSRKARTIFEHFEREKIATPEILARVACPVGVKIRCQTVQEIAVSIMAQYVDKRAEMASAQRPTGAYSYE